MCPPSCQRYVRRRRFEWARAVCAYAWSVEGAGREARAAALRAAREAYLDAHSHLTDVQRALSLGAGDPAEMAHPH